MAFGCNVLATRSLFECVSSVGALGMFAELCPHWRYAQRQPTVSRASIRYSELALAVYDRAISAQRLVGTRMSVGGRAARRCKTAHAVDRCWQLSLEMACAKWGSQAGYCLLDTATLRFAPVRLGGASA
jgi:hypothetical protein